MPYAATSTTQDSIAGPVLIVLLLGAGTIYLFGYARAVLHLTNADYKATKAKVKPLRKAFWKAWWRAVKVGFWVVTGLVLLIVWAVHDTRR